MPWVERHVKPKRPVRARELCSLFGSIESEILATLQAAWKLGLLTQGIGLRPQPWAKISRPVGSVLHNLYLPAVPHPPPQRLPHGLEAVIEVDLQLARHEDVLEKIEDAVHMIGKFPDQPRLLEGLGAER